MTKQEEILCKKILSKTKSGEIKWQSQDSKNFFAPVGGSKIRIAVYTSYYGYECYRLTIKDGELSADLLSDWGPLKELWNLLDKNLGASFQNEQLISKLSGLLDTL